MSTKFPLNYKISKRKYIIKLKCISSSLVSNTRMKQPLFRIDEPQSRLTESPKKVWKKVTGWWWRRSFSHTFPGWIGYFIIPSCQLSCEPASFFSRFVSFETYFPPIIIQIIMSSNISTAFNNDSFIDPSNCCVVKCTLT